MQEKEEEEEKAPSGISWPAAPSGARNELHFNSDRKSDSRVKREEQGRITED